MGDISYTPRVPGPRGPPAHPDPKTTESEPQRVALLEGVLLFEMRFMAANSQIRGEDLDTDDWPEAWGMGSSAADQAPPGAVEVILELEDLGEVRWLYELPVSQN